MVHHRGVRETRCARFLRAEVKAKDEGAKEATGGELHPARREGRWGRISPVRMRDAFRDLSGRRLLRLASVVRDILSAIRFGVRVSYPPRVSAQTSRWTRVQDRGQELPPPAAVVKGGNKPCGERTEWSVNIRLRHRPAEKTIHDDRSTFAAKEPGRRRGQRRSGSA